MSRLCICLWVLISIFRKLQAVVLLGLLLWLACVYRLAHAAPSVVWEAGRLDYNNGESEVAAFVNQEQVQLQVVLCSLNTVSPYRMTLLLSRTPNLTGLIPVTLLVDGATTNAYAEVSGNALEFQVGIPFIISLTYSPSLEIIFSKEDAKALKLPESLQISMALADLALNEVARSCTLLCQNQGFSCNQPLLSGILWPRNGFDHEGDRSDPSVGTYRELLGVDSDETGALDSSSSSSSSTSASYDVATELGQVESNWPQSNNDFSNDDIDSLPSTSSIDDSVFEESALDKANTHDQWPSSKWGDEELTSADTGLNYQDGDESFSESSSLSTDHESATRFDDVSDFNYVQAEDKNQGSVSGSSVTDASLAKDNADSTSADSEGESFHNFQNTQDASNNAKSKDEIDLSQDALNHSCLQWPRTMSGYERSISDMYTLTPSFKLNAQCKNLLDQRFERDGKWALSFMPAIFKSPQSAYQDYQKHWNVLVKAVDPKGELPDTMLSDDDYYLALFTLFTTTNLHEFPQSYFDILNFDDDPATFIYAMDNRYDLETIKYYAVLDRRLKGSASLLQTASHTYQVWEKFYQEFSSALPPIPKAQALRPLLYRQMLMRVWRLAGYPDPLHLKPQYAFTQGTNHHTITREPLEAKCSIFEGTQGDQFFFASPECVRSVFSDLRRLGYLNDDFKQVQLHWDAFAKATIQSQLLSLNGSGQLTDNNRAGLTLALLSMYKIYGFGDYFLLRNCLSTRDSDICQFQSFKAQQDYFNEVRNTISSVSVSSEKDAKMLNQLNELWRLYYDSLKVYTEGLVRRGKIKPWRAHFVQGVATTTQTETLLSGPYYQQPIEPED